MTRISWTIKQHILNEAVVDIWSFTFPSVSAWLCSLYEISGLVTNVMPYSQLPRTALTFIAIDVRLHVLDNSPFQHSRLAVLLAILCRTRGSDVNVRHNNDLLAYLLDRPIITRIINYPRQITPWSLVTIIDTR